MQNPKVPKKITNWVIHKSKNKNPGIPKLTKKHEV